MKKESVRTGRCYYILTFSSDKRGNTIPRVDRVRVDKKYTFSCLVCNMTGDGLMYCYDYFRLNNRKELRKVVESYLKDLLEKYKRLIEDTQSAVNAFGEELERIDNLLK